jgi:hypothetical protein
MRMIVLGDSVTWGQGLLPAQKFSTLVYSQLPSQTPDNSSLTVLAHSGATIGVCATISKPALDGEVPDSYSTVIQQCASYENRPEAADVVIVNGGINDVDVFTIVNPLTDSDDLHELINQHCYLDMLTLLGQVTAKFTNPATRIVVPSYFPILSRESDPIRLPHFLGLYGVQLTPLLTNLGDIVFDKIFDHCRMSNEKSGACLGKAVTEINQQQGGKRVRFAQVPFTASNSVLAPDAWLWGIKADSSPEDPVRRQRHAACDLDERDPIRRDLCYRASVGHPNITGAKQFAQAILSTLV